jgi:uncharacterized protein (DUF362 family)
VKAAPVYLTRTTAAYAAQAPFHPDAEYPEYPFRGRGAVSTEPNPAYAGLRRLFVTAGLDAGRAGTPGWNPLGALVQPGDRVLLKPNLVYHQHPHADGWVATLTHGSVVRAILDYVFIALGGRGEVWIGDVPLQSADFATVAAFAGLGAIHDFYRERAALDVPILDLRALRVRANTAGAIVHSEHVEGDPRGTVPVDLDGRSMHARGPDKGHLLRVSHYDRSATVSHHTRGRHEYCIARTALDADVFINIPKLKTHCKAGVTIAMKNLIGINADKSWLPHYAAGSPARGDEYETASLVSWLRSAAKERLYDRPLLHRVVRTVGLPLLRYQARREKAAGADLPPEASPIGGGAWHGNDTLWRTIIDLNRVVFYARSDGTMAETPQRRYLAIVDGIVAGQGQGPLAPDPLLAGALLLGTNPVAVDVAGATLLGMDPARLPQITRAFEPSRYPLIDGTADDVTVISDVPEWSGLTALRAHSLRARAPVGWRGHVELPGADAEREAG